MPGVSTLWLVHSTQVYRWPTPRGGILMQPRTMTQVANQTKANRQTIRHDVFIYSLVDAVLRKVCRFLQIKRKKTEIKIKFPLFFMAIQWKVQAYYGLLLWMIVHGRNDKYLSFLSLLILCPLLLLEDNWKLGFHTMNRPTHLYTYAKKMKRLV